MGRDKALTRLEDDGPTLIETTVARLRLIVEDVFIVATDRPEYAGFAETVADEFSGAGVLGGIATGLHHAGGRDLLVVACDHPFLSVPLLTFMSEVDASYDALVPKTRGRSKQGGEFILQTLHAIYRPSCLPALEREISNGYKNSTGFFDRVHIRAIEEDELRRFDPDLRSLWSANTPEALDRAREIARAGPEGGPVVDYTQWSY